jgi:proline iminopeptidase
VLGHSFGGEVALEYALRYPDNLSHLVLLDTGGDSRWDQENAPDLLAKRGYGPKKVELARRWFNGEFPREFYPIFMRIGGAYYHRGRLSLLSELARGIVQRWHPKMRPEAQIFGFSRLTKGWTVIDRLGDIKVPTLVMAGRDDFVFPPHCQEQLAAGIPNARLRIIERAGHNPHSEQPDETMKAVGDFLFETAIPQARH